MAKTGVLGAGSWGTALAMVLNDNDHEVTVWSISEEEVNLLNGTHEHPDKLPGVSIDPSIVFTTDIKSAIAGQELLVLAVPSVFIRSTAKSMAPYVEDGQIIVIVSKGIEESTLKILSEVVEEEIPQAHVCAMSGPSHAEEVARRLPTTVVAGAKKKEDALKIQSIFMNEHFRVYTSPDLLGIELGGSLKNVIALAAGMADGLGFGDNTKAALITRGIKEITDLALAMGAKAETLSGLSGIGDLIVTCASMHSRNRRAGILMGQGKSMQEAMDEVKMVVEGVYSAKAALNLAEKYGLSMPIIREVNAVLFENKSAAEGVADLMHRNKKLEYDDLDW